MKKVKTEIWKQLPADNNFVPDGPILKAIVHI